METDPCLSEYSHLILDEIHERDVMSDFLITLIKEIIAHRKDLKVILMSATLNAEKFSAYYDNCAQIVIPGFTYPVQEFYLEDAIERTGFQFLEKNVKKKNWQEHRRNRNDQFRDREYLEYIEPYIRELERDRKYSRNTCIQLRNPESEKLSLDLIFALLVDICQKVSTVLLNDVYSLFVVSL